MAKIETEILSKAVSKPIVWKRYIDYVFSLWDMSKTDIATSIEQANLHHPTIKFTAEISATETVFLDTIVYKGTRCKDQKTHVKPTETFQYTDFTSCHPPSNKRRSSMNPQNTLSRKTFENLKYICGIEVTHTIW